MTWVALLAIVLQAVNLAANLFGAPGALNKATNDRAQSDLHAFSGERNVLIVLVDTLQADVVQQILDEYPADLESFDGFVFFRNSLAGYPTTKVNVPLILSGQYFQNRINAAVFTESVSRSDSNLPRFLKDRGFRTHLIGTRNLFVADEENSDIHVEFLRNAAGLNLGKELAYLLDLAAFRSFPHYAKRWIHNDQKWCLANLFVDQGLGDMPPVENLYDLKFVHDFVGHAFVDEGSPVFKYLHFWGAHPPNRLNEKLEYVEMPHGRDNFVTYTRASISMLGQMFAKLKEIGAYDNTLIVVTGDHGAGFHQYPADPRVGGVSDVLVEDTTVERLVKSSALAAILVKEIGSRGPFRIDDRPVTLGDYPASIASSLGFDHRFPGVDFLRHAIDPARERFFYFYQGFNTNSDNFFEGFTPYRIVGHSWLDASWMRHDGLRLDSDEVGTCDLGERIVFAAGGNYTEFAPFGFSIAGPEFAWSDRNVAGFAARITNSSGDLRCLINLKRVWGTNQRIEVWLNGNTLLADWFYEKGSEADEVIEIRIPADSLNDGLIALEFRLPNANMSPKDVGLSSDGRRLGIGLGWVEFQSWSE